jgi:hypothetical protein
VRAATIHLSIQSHSKHAYEVVCVRKVWIMSFWSSKLLLLLLLLYGSAAQRGLWPPRSRGFVITHNNAPQSVGMLWTSDQLVAETYT